METKNMQCKTIADTKVYYPKGKRLSLRRQVTISKAIERLRESFGQDVWRVFLNGDKYDAEQFYSLTFTFNTDTRFDDDD